MGVAHSYSERCLQASKTLNIKFTLYKANIKLQTLNLKP